MGSPTDTTAWQSLQAHSALFKQPDFQLTHLYNADASRFDKFSLRHDNLLLDLSKNLVTEQTLALLVELAEQQQVPAAIEAMFTGATINTSEQRPALHIALREPVTAGRFPEVQDTLARMEALVRKLRTGNWRGYSGKAITDVVNLGVGGSDLGPALAVTALRPAAPSTVELHFVSNIDPLQIETTLQRLDPETTLFIVASKSFTTLETLHNARTARRWLAAHAGPDAPLSMHFLAVTAKPEAAQEFGIEPAHTLPLWDWVGGRYSLWSAIGLPIAISLGMDSFRQLLAGAHAMDQHFRQAPLRDNLPVMLALLAIWYRGFFDAHSSAVIPYSRALQLLPAYLQQLAMESLGKSVNQRHEPVALHTGEPIWGTVGTDVQHSCFQLLHQGTNFIPVDFILAARPASANDAAANQQLMANCFSQSLALMQGHPDDAAPFRTLRGNKPSNTLLLAELNPYNLGSLLALYEHKVYVQSIVWDINAFDQWGVELGKQLSREIFAALSESSPDTQLHPSTRNLIACARHWNK